GRSELVMPTWIGIDIGTASVKVAVLKTSYRKVGLVGLGAATLQPDSDVAAAVRAAVREAAGEKGGTGDGVATVLSGTKAAVRNMVLPASAQKQLGEVLPFELDGEVPFEVAEAVLDYRVVTTGRVEELDPTKLDVLVAAAPIEDARAR